MDFEVEAVRLGGRPKKTWSEVIETDPTITGTHRGAADHRKWRS